MRRHHDLLAGDVMQTFGPASRMLLLVAGRLEGSPKSALSFSGTYLCTYLGRYLHYTLPFLPFPTLTINRDSDGAHEAECSVNSASRLSAASKVLPRESGGVPTVSTLGSAPSFIERHKNSSPLLQINVYINYVRFNLLDEDRYRLQLAPVLL